jgi:hypothetical protein
MTLADETPKLMAGGQWAYIHIFLQKVHVENFPQRNRQKVRCQFSLAFLGFIAFSGVSQRWEFKSPT